MVGKAVICLRIAVSEVAMVISVEGGKEACEVCGCGLKAIREESDVFSQKVECIVLIELDDQFVQILTHLREWVLNIDFGVLKEHVQ